MRIENQILQAEIAVGRDSLNAFAQQVAASQRFQFRHVPSEFVDVIHQPVEVLLQPFFGALLFLNCFPMELGEKPGGLPQNRGKIPWTSGDSGAGDAGESPGDKISLSLELSFSDQLRNERSWPRANAVKVGGIDFHAHMGALGQGESDNDFWGKQQRHRRARDVQVSGVRRGDADVAQQAVNKAVQPRAFGGNDGIGRGEFAKDIHPFAHLHAETT